jgi:hypothetical protein
MKSTGACIDIVRGGWVGAITAKAALDTSAKRPVSSQTATMR